jgi:tRNA (mo5U34)-methyltransferase
VAGLLRPVADLEKAGLRMTRDEKLQLIDKVPFWFHSIDCGDGVITNGVKPLAILHEELAAMAVPRLAGKTVLDIGAWDGFFSFAAEESGAKRVTALDHYVWSMDIERQQRYWKACREQGIPPTPYHLVPGHWDPGTLPGKRAFDTVHRIKRSSVEQLVADFMTVDLVEVGQFDVVYFLGVLYHLEEPYKALKRLSLITREVAIIETAAVYLPPHEDVGIFEFYESNELAADVGNWFAPNAVGLAKACRAAGFRGVNVTSSYPPVDATVASAQQVQRYRLTVHAYK